MLMDVQPASGFWEGEVMPLSRWTKFRSTNINDVHAHMSRMMCQHQLDTEGGAPPIAFRHNQAVLKAMTFNATDYGNPYGRIAINIPAAENLCLVQFSLSGTSRISQQDETFDLTPGHLCVLSSYKPVRQVLQHGYKHFTIKVPRNDLEAVLAQELGYQSNQLEFSPKPVPLVGAAAAFAHLIRTICDDIDSGLAAYNHARTAGSVEDTLKRLLLAAVPHNHSDLFDAAPSSPAPYYVRRAEEYIRQHAGDPISLADLIEVSGVSARSLHAAFKRFRNTTPMIYLKNRRLEIAQRLLKSGMDEGLTVTDVAITAGFTHLSRFARSYYERFGERPSTTLKRIGA